MPISVFTCSLVRFTQAVTQFLKYNMRTVPAAPLWTYIAKLTFRRSDDSTHAHTLPPGHLAHILWLRHLTSHRSQIAIQRTTKELQQHLEADSGESWVVTTPVESFCQQEKILEVHTPWHGHGGDTYLDSSSRMNACCAHAGS